MSFPSALVISLSFERRYEELESLLRVQREFSPEGTALAGLSDALREKLGQLEMSGLNLRYILVGLDVLASNLMDYEYWSDAELALNVLVQLSLTHNEAFFLNDARLRQVACRTLLGRTRDLKNMKAQIPPGTRFFMRGEFWYLEDM